MAAPMTLFFSMRITSSQPLLHICKRLGFSFTRYIASKQSIRSILKDGTFDKKRIGVNGWVKAVQKHRDVEFLRVSDGSCVKPLQVVAPPGLIGREVTFGSCVSVEGRLVESEHSGQNVELRADKIEVVGHCDPVEYPFKARKKHLPEYVRTFPQLRPKTNTFSSMLRIRNAATMAFHKFFQDNDFCMVHTPILTSNDCEGAGEVFVVEPADLEMLKSLSSDSSSDTDPKHFFGCPAFMTVSGQLHLEVMTGALARVYTFGPTFRAENSRSRLHLSEFYMVEAEMAFTDGLQDVTQIMEDMIKSTLKYVLHSAEEDIHFYTKSSNNEKHKEDLDRLMNNAFEQLTYTEAVALLQKNSQGFQFPVEWGLDLQKEHERRLTELLGKVPVFVTDFPTKLKPFYAKANQDDRTVGAVDLLVPGIGELIGGSLREENYDTLHRGLTALGKLEQFQWYLDLRKFGSVPHGGFGLGFERYLQFLLGTLNIRDVIPFPRSPRNCKL